MISMKLIIFSVILGVIMKVAESGTGEYYGNACYYEYFYNLTWYPHLDIIINTSDINIEYQYLYSPCNLSFYSSEFDRHFAMKRYDLKTGIEQYLIPELSNYPAQGDTNQPIATWEFKYTYTNESCPDLVQIVYVYWQCNATINNYPYYYEMVSAGPLFDCFDSIFIQSPFACGQHYGWLWPTYEYKCTFTSNDKTIDLDKYLTNRVINVSPYYWTPCRNQMLGSNTQEKPSKNNWAMISEYNTGVYSTWNLLSIDENMYDYDPVINVWNFTFIGYNISRRVVSTTYHCDVFSTYILFGCDCSQSKEQYTHSIEPEAECYMIFNITRNDLCINYIDQCFPNINNTDCVYYYRPNASEPYDKLNLSSLTDTQIGGIEQGGLYAFIYTPCNNNFLCSNDSTPVSSMAGRKKINANECIEPLGIFNGTDGFLVEHDYRATTWVIEYFNGGECPTNPDQTVHFRTTWTYSSDVVWKVTYVEFFEDQCLYDVSITSKFAGPYLYY